MDDHDDTAAYLRKDPTTRIAPGFEVRTSAGAGVCRITVCGEADATSKAQLSSLREQIDLSHTPEVLISLSRLKFCDVGTARALLDLGSEVRADGGAVHVTDPPGLTVRLLLKILDAGDDLPLPPSPDGELSGPPHGEHADVPAT